MSVKTNSGPITAQMPVNDIRQAFEQARRVLVASHVDPDGDAIGTQLAFGMYLTDLGKEVVLTRDSEIPDKYLFLPGVDRIVPANTVSQNVTVDTALILECPTILRIGSAARFLNEGVVVLNIDHHQDNAGFGSVNWIDRRMSSVGEMAYEYFRSVGYRLKPETAEQLYTAILTDTGRFRFTSTSPRTFEIAGELVAAGANPRKVCDLVYFNMQPSSMKLIGKVLNGIEFHQNGRICMLTLTKQMLVEAGAAESETDGLVDYTMFSKGVMAGLLAREIDATHTKVSLRSVDGVDVARIAYLFGGGGHFNAAGCMVPKPLQETKTEMIRLLVEANHGMA